MAIPSIPQGFYTSQGNRQVLVQWAITAGATSYDVQRSLDGVTYASVATPSATQYLDTAVTAGTQYYYKVAATNVDGTSPYTTPQNLVPTPTGEQSLGEMRTSAQQRADRVNSNFVTTPEWNAYLNQAMYELYDLLITQYEDYFKAPPASFTVNGSAYVYPLPDGLIAFLDNNNNSFVAAPLYKMLGMDLAVNTANNGYVNIPKYNFVDRNTFVYPNTASTIYGVFNLRYRMMGQNVEFIPTPSGNQKIRIQYIPRIPKLLADTDLTTTGISDWNEYIILKAAILALTKEESDTSKLETQLQYQIERIQDSSVNRDAGQPDTISNTRGVNGSGWGHGGTAGGWGTW
jgi:hypothetical protein